MRNIFTFTAHFLTAALSASKRKALAVKHGLTEDKVQELSELDPTPNNAYLDWVCRFFVMGKVDEGITEVLQKFNRLKDNPEFSQSKNVFDYTPETLGALFAKKLRHQLKDMTPGTLGKTIKEKGLPGAKLILNDGIWKIWKVQNPEYAIILSSGTSWCTTQMGNARSYCNRGALYPIYKNDTPFGQGFLDVQGALEFKTTENRDFELTTPGFIEMMKAAKDISQIGLFVGSVLARTSYFQLNIPDDWVDMVKEIILDRDDYGLLKTFLKKVYWEEGWELMLDINSEQDITNLVKELPVQNPFFESPYAEEVLDYLTEVGPGFLKMYAKLGRLSEFFKNLVGQVDLRGNPNAGVITEWIEGRIADGSPAMSKKELDNAIEKLKFRPEDYSTVLYDYWVKCGDGKPLGRIHRDMMQYSEPYAEYFGRSPWGHAPEVADIPGEELEMGARVAMEYDGSTLVYIHSGQFFNRAGTNALIFEMLGVDATEFCTEAYGYGTYGGDWPEWRAGDDQAPVRVLRKLQERGVRIILDPSLDMYIDDGNQRDEG